MIAEQARVGARGTDSLSAISPDHAKALRSAGFDFSVRYLGSITPDELEGVLSAGLALMVVTFADAFDGSQTVQRAQALGLPSGTTVWLDVEGQKDWATPPAELIAKINAWASVVKLAGYEPGLYVGAPQPLTSKELYGLEVVRYWHGQGRCVDRAGALAEPDCGWCMWQMWPSVTIAGVLVDVDVIGADYQRRLPTWAIRPAQ